MDPNATLAEIREITSLHQQGEIADALDSFDRLAELTFALDEWISKGGFLPAAWAAGR
jgi:hypothetical protein